MSSTATALVPAPAQRAVTAVSSSAKATTGFVSQTAKTAQSLVSTPKRTSPAQVSGSAAPDVRHTLPPPSPGTFRHPKLTEIIARQSKNSFTERNVKDAGVNAGALVLSLAFSGYIHSSLDTILNLVRISDTSSIISPILLLLRLFLIANTILSLRPMIPYFSTEDQVTDIPLTPSQRSLLGLNPSTQSTSASGTSAGFITPPRYSRSSGLFPTPQTAPSERRSISANYSSSPLSTSRYTIGFSPSPSQPQSFRRTASGSPFSPSPNASPLLHKAVTQSTQDLDFGISRSSFGGSTSNFGLGRSQSVRERGAHERRSSAEPGTPTPGKRSPGLNYKWLYDRGGRLPKSESMGF